MFIHTTATTKLLALKSKIRVVAGGTSAGKTISILQILIDLAQSKENLLISVVSETFPHLSRGAQRDFLNIMEQHMYFEPDRWNKTEHMYTFPTNSKIEFFSADQPGKVRGPRRDILFVNEANNVDYESFDQLLVRTSRVIWIDFNPTHEFWYYTELKPNYEHDFITLTYKDNEGLSQSIIDSIEAHKHNKNWWLVYGLGQLGEHSGQIFTNWAQIQDIPHEARLERRGLDFGYTNDPTALIDVYYYNGGFILDERIYRKGLTNKQIADFIVNMDHPEVSVFADSAEPKSIDELRYYGINILGAQKGPGSILQGINYVQDQQISVTKRSTNIIHEYRNYMWEADKDNSDIHLNKPIDGFNHAMDALRYALETYMRAGKSEVGVVTSTPDRPEDKSFMVNEKGEAEAYHIDLAKAIKESEPNVWS